MSASVDAELLEAGQQAVEAGEVESLSAWVNGALHRQVEHDRRLRALDEFIGAYEAEYGEITRDEMQDAARRAHRSAVMVSPDTDIGVRSGRHSQGAA